MKQSLPPRPRLAQLKRQAKELLKQFRAGVHEASLRFAEHHPRLPEPAAVSLSDAQLVIAREYDFASWPKLKHHVEGLESLENRVAVLRAEFAAGDTETKRRLLQPAHNATRFENYDPNAPSLSDADARLLIANQEGYALWNKYESYLHLDPAVRQVIAAVRSGDLEGLREILRTDPAAANPHWVSGFPLPKPIPNDSIPLFCVSEAVFSGKNPRGNEYEIIRALIAAGADVNIEGDIVLGSAVSYNTIQAIEALLDCGAPIDGVDGDGVPLAYAMRFGFAKAAELMARRGAKLDLRFSAGLGHLDAVKNWFEIDGTLKPGAGALADPYGQEQKQQGQSPFRCERTRRNILSQALCFACVQNRLAVADFLLVQGAEINAMVPGMDGRFTVLHQVACMEGGFSAARFLLDRGADPEIRDGNHHSTPAGWARYCKQDRTAELLAETIAARLQIVRQASRPRS